MCSEDRHAHFCDLVEGDTTGRVGYSSTWHQWLNHNGSTTF